jgi:uncharacterized protein (TIGR03435 family)
MQPMLMECAVRAMLIAIGTAAVLAMLGVKTAAARHAAWSGVVLAMLVLPLWTAWGPKAALRVLPQGAARAAAVLHAPAPLSARPVVADRAPNNPAPSRHGWNWGTIALGAYLLGVCALLLRLGIGTARARRLLRHAASDDGVMVSPCCSAPVTVGWLHPSVILPPGWREWPEGKLNAVLAHEREHARRRDPLVQWLALLNRALFWFHPLAWWLERRVCALAEEACDGAAIAHGHDPRDYSEYLLEFARSVEHSGSRIQEWGMAMPGGFLGQRIHQILAAAPAPRTSRARLACAAAACTLAAVVFTAGRLDSIHAQTAVFVPAGPVFEDVSIQVMPVYRGNEAAAALKYRPPAPGTIQHWHQNLKALVMEAFAVEEYRVEGRTGRDAEMSPSYTITAKAPPKDMPEAQVREMLQRLLVERFHLALHWERKVVPLYYLVAGPNAMQGLVPEEEGKDSVYAPGRGRFHARKVTLSRLAFALSHSMPRYAIDKTGITGAYTFDLDWTADATEWGRYSLPRSPLFDPSPDHPLAPSLVAALDGLGLKLEPHEEMMDVIVIDHADAVTQNQ